MLAIYSQEAVRAAETFTASDVLGWKKSNQDWYFETSVGMAAVVAAENPGTQAECVDDWYFASVDAANDEIRDVMRRFPTYHPAGVILAVIEKKCGSFNFTK